MYRQCEIDHVTANTSYPFLCSTAAPCLIGFMAQSDESLLLPLLLLEEIDGHISGSLNLQFANDTAFAVRDEKKVGDNYSIGPAAERAGRRQ